MTHTSGFPPLVFSPAVPPPFRLSDLEKSVEELQKEASVSHKLAPVQDLEEKAALIRKLGETLTELKSQSHTHTHSRPVTPHRTHTRLACVRACRHTHTNTRTYTHTHVRTTF